MTAMPRHCARPGAHLASAPGATGRWVIASLTAVALTAGLAGSPAARADEPAAAPAAAAPSAPAAAPITLDLNKLEPLPGSSPGCRAYIVVANPDPKPIPKLTIDVILFNNDGVIARRLALDLAPLAARKTAVRLFDLQGLPCDDIAQVLINDVLTCETGDDSGKPAEVQRQACLDRLTPSSRAKAKLTK
jgi:hypothetical protein